MCAPKSKKLRTCPSEDISDLTRIWAKGDLGRRIFDFVTHKLTFLVRLTRTWDVLSDQSNTMPRCSEALIWHFSMALDANESNKADSLESRLDRLWNDRLSVPIGAGVDRCWGRYEIQRVVGAGGFGIVYLATDPRTKESVAVKVPRREVLVEKEKLRRFTTEAALVSELNHPNIVKFREADVDGPVPWLATEWCDGSDLAAWLQRVKSDGPIPWTEAVELVMKIADAVDHVHQHGFAHRDLKPANIMLCRIDDSKSNSLRAFLPKVADFGLSKLHGGEINTHSSFLIGTPVYMAPEQLDGWKCRIGPSEESAFAADIYSLGAILFELLAGQPPVGGRSFHEVLDNVRNSHTVELASCRPDLPKGVYQIVKTCLCLNPEARYKTAKDLALDLKRCLAGEKIEGQSISAVSKYQFWHARQSWLPTAGRFAMISGGLIAIWLVIAAVAGILCEVVSPEGLNRAVGEAFLVLTTSTMPIVLLGWMCIKRKRWAALVGAIFNLGNLVAPVFGMIGHPLAFEGIYYGHHIYFCFTIHLFIFLCYLVQEILFVFAYLSSSSDTKVV